MLAIQAHTLLSLFLNASNLLRAAGGSEFSDIPHFKNHNPAQKLLPIRTTLLAQEISRLRLRVLANSESALAARMRRVHRAQVLLEVAQNLGLVAAVVAGHHDSAAAFFLVFPHVLFMLVSARAFRALVQFHDLRVHDVHVVHEVPLDFGGEIALVALEARQSLARLVAVRAKRVDGLEQLGTPVAGILEQSLADPTGQVLRCHCAAHGLDVAFRAVLCLAGRVRRVLRRGAECPVLRVSRRLVGIDICK